MYNEQHQYRVRFQGDSRRMCVIEGEAPIDVERMRAFIARQKRVFDLAGYVEIRVIERNTVIDRRDVTRNILGSMQGTTQEQKMRTIRRVLEEHEDGRISALESYHAVRDLFSRNIEEAG